MEVKKRCMGIIRRRGWRSDARQVPTIKKWEEVNVEHQANNYGQVRDRTFHAWERDIEFKVEEEEAKFREIYYNPHKSCFFAKIIKCI